LEQQGRNGDVDVLDRRGKKRIFAVAKDRQQDAPVNEITGGFPFDQRDAQFIHPQV
jgi:hypothetical protein